MSSGSVECHLNKFFDDGHLEQVDLDEKAKLLEAIPSNRKSDAELSIIYSTVPRKPVAIKRTPKSSNRTPRTIKVSSRQGFVNYQTRLTNKVSSAAVVKPQMKLGIFNHFCRSASLKLKSFSEDDLVVVPSNVQNAIVVNSQPEIVEINVLENEEVEKDKFEDLCHVEPVHSNPVETEPIPFDEQDALDAPDEEPDIDLENLEILSESSRCCF